MTSPSFETEIAMVLGLPDLEHLTIQHACSEALRTPQRKNHQGCYTRCFGARRIDVSVFPKSDPEERQWGYYPEHWFPHPFHWRGAPGWIGTGMLS